MARLLLVEDDEAISQSLARALGRDGHDVDAVGSGEEAMDRFERGGIDLVILDVGLPGIDGVEVCRRIRRIDAAVPILMLTARVEELDVVLGLDAGSDDHVAKPFRLAELLARVRANLRRIPDRDQLVEGQIRVDVAARRVWVDGAEVALSPKEFDLLALLVRHAGTVVTREQIMEEVWDEHWFGSTKTLDVHVSWLRRKLGDDASGSGHITTVRGIGFRFERA